MTMRLMKNIQNVLQKRNRKNLFFLNNVYICHDEKERHDGGDDNSREHCETQNREHLTGLVSVGVDLDQCEQLLPEKSAFNTVRKICFSASIFSPPYRKRIYLISQFFIELLSIRKALVFFKALQTANIVGMVIHHFFCFLPMFSLMQMLDQIFLYFERFSSDVSLMNRRTSGDTL